MTIPASIRMWDLRPEDEGWYHCLITYMNRVPEDMPSPNGTWVYLSVHSPPKFVETSESIVILKEGMPLKIFCKADATPNPEISWFRDGFLLESSTLPHIVVSNDTLEILSARRSDAGVYVCRAKNVVGEQTRSIKVLQGGVFIMTPPLNLTVVEGRRVELTCAAEARPDNITYHWYKGGDWEVGGEISGSSGSSFTAHHRLGSSVLKDPSLGPRSNVVKESGTLVISSIFGADSGWYFCEATNGLSSSTAKAFLNVTYSPKMLRMPETLYLAKGKPAKIACRVEANPPVDLVKWRKDDIPFEESRYRDSDDKGFDQDSSLQLAADLKTFGISLDTSTRTKRTFISSSSSSDWRFIDGGLTIFFGRADSHHDGVYSCTPSNSVGSSATSTPVRVFVRDPPVFTLVPRKYEQRTLDDFVTLTCFADGDPSPVVRWRKLRRDDGNSVVGNGVGRRGNKVGEELDNLPHGRTKINEGNLTISHLVLEDAGVYECRAENVVTTIAATVSLIIEVKKANC